MEFLELFGAVAAILDESIKLVPRNKRLLSMIVGPTLLLSSIFFMVFNFSCKSLLRDMVVKASFLPISSPNTVEFSSILAGLKEDFGLLLLVEVIFTIACFAISLYSTTATILVSEMSHSGRTLSTKDFLLVIVRSLRRPIITGFYTTLLVTGYFFFVLCMASPILMFSCNSMAAVLSTAIWVGIVASLFYLYLAVVWIMSLVLSVIEENCYGIEALGKADGLVRGKRLHGFVLNIIFNLLSFIAFQGFRIIWGHKWSENQTICWLFLVNISCLLKIFQLTAYTVLYFQCKKNHGEEILELQFQGDIEYSNLSDTPQVVDMP